MVKWWWLLVVFWGSGMFGYFLCALMVIASENKS